MTLEREWRVKLGITRERREGERRVAATPETVQQLIGLGLEVLVESRAGTAAGHGDAEYARAGARIVPELDPGSLDILAHVRPLDCLLYTSPSPRDS